MTIDEGSGVEWTCAVTSGARVPEMPMPPSLNAFYNTIRTKSPGARFALVSRANELCPSRVVPFLWKLHLRSTGNFNVKFLLVKFHPPGDLLTVS